MKPVLTTREVLEMQQLERRRPAPFSLVKYAVAIARATRPDESQATAAVKNYVSLGAGPRAGQNLMLGVKAQAAMDGRAVPESEDVDAVAISALRNGVGLKLHPEAERIPSIRQPAGRSVSC